METKKVGEAIGEGFNKTCYLLGDSEIALIPRPEADEESKDMIFELRLYERLAKAGIDVPPVRVETVLLGRRRRRALVMPRYRYHSRDNDSGLTKWVDKKMLKSLERIFFQIKKAQLVAYDIQFVWNTTDRLMVCDPGSVYQLTGDPYNNENLLGIAAFIGVYRHQFKFKTKIPMEFIQIAQQGEWAEDIG
jgi:hypothetical protein